MSSLQKLQEKEEVCGLRKKFKLDNEHSYKTLNEKPGAYEGSPGATVFQVGGKSKPEAVECNREKEEEVSLMSAVSGMSARCKNSVPSKEEVILEMMRKANISITDLTEGSAPNYMKGLQARQCFRWEEKASRKM